MNKKQLIVAWVMGTIIAGLILSAPRERLVPHGSGYVRPSPKSYAYDLAIERIKWDFVLQGSLIVLIFGSLLIYTLRDKKK